MTPAEYKECRERIGTQVSVAQRLGVHPLTISRRERGEIPITVEAELAIRRLARGRAVGKSAGLPRK